MPKPSFTLVALPPKKFSTQGTARTDPTKLEYGTGPGSVWTPRLTPILTLLQEVLADLFAVRDHVLQAQRHGRQPLRVVLRQYEKDLQWLNSPEEAPFSFG
jgi:hypothetical protein